MAERYRAGRILIAAAGAVRHDDLVAALAPSFGAIEPAESELAEIAPVAAAGVTVAQKALEQAHVCLGIPAVSQDDPDRYAAQVLNVALGGGMSSRLFQRIREERGRAYSVYSFLSAFSDCGYLGVYAGTSPEWVPEVVALIEGTIDEARRDGLERHEVERARSQLKANLLLGLETSDSRMSRLARGCLTFGRAIDLQEICDALDLVTPDDVARVADRFGRSGERCLTVLGDVDAAAVGLG
jgi:predicted Zn-dependent peptidase